MSFLPFRPLLTRRLGPSLLVCFLLVAAGCGGGSSDSMDATPEDVDENTPVEITQAERAAFDAPSDSVLTEAQVEMFIKTSLLQFDLVRKHSERIHERAAAMEERAKEGGALASLRNLMEAGQTLAEYGNLIGGSYIRSARTLGYNPAEMEWVRDRMAETATYLAMEPMRQSMQAGAAEMRASLAEMRAQIERGEAPEGASEADLDAMLQSLEEAEASTAAGPVGAVARNIEVLRRARPNVTDPMWTAIGISAGSMGLMSLSGLADPNDQEAQKKLDELRSLFTDALENRVSPGMETE